MPSVDQSIPIGSGKNPVAIELPDERYRDVLNEAFDRNLRFWQEEPANFRIIVTEDDERFQTLAGNYYAPYAAGVATDDGLVVFRGMESLERIGADYTSWQELQNGIAHEIAHGFWVKLLRGGTESEWTPVWMMEGIPSWVGDQKWQVAGKELLNKLAQVYGEWTPDPRAVPWSDMSYIGAGKENIKASYSLWAELLKHISAQNPSTAINMLKDLGDGPWEEAEFSDAFRNTFNNTLGESLEGFIESISK